MKAGMVQSVEIASDRFIDYKKIFKRNKTTTIRNFSKKRVMGRNVQLYYTQTSE